MISRRWLIKIAIAGFVANLVPPMALAPQVQTSGWSNGALQVGDVFTIEVSYVVNPPGRSALRKYVITDVISDEQLNIKPL